MTRNREGITNVYIKCLLSEYCPKFGGVYSSNDIPNKLLDESDYGIVVNLSDVGERGSHFIAIVCLPSHVLYIDSYGHECQDRDICGFLSKLNKPVYYNRRQIQSYDSNFCGFFSMLYVLHYCTRVNVNLKFSDRDLLRNDDLCISYLCQYLQQSNK